MMERKKNEGENIINLKLSHNFYVTTPPKSTNTETVIFETLLFPFTFIYFFQCFHYHVMIRTPTLHLKSSLTVVDNSTKIQEKNPQKRGRCVKIQVVLLSESKVDRLCFCCFIRF